MARFCEYNQWSRGTLPSRSDWTRPLHFHPPCRCRVPKERKRHSAVWRGIVRSAIGTLVLPSLGTLRLRGSTHSCQGIALTGHSRVSSYALCSFLSSTWGRADQQTSQDSNRVWGVLFCAPDCCER